MAKSSGFAAKVAKGSSARAARVCPECGQTIAAVKLVTSEPSPIKKSWKFNQRFVSLCKCNEDEVYGK